MRFPHVHSLVLLQILFLRTKAPANPSHLLLLLQPYSLQLLISQSQPLSLSLRWGGIGNAIFDQRYLHNRKKSCSLPCFIWWGQRGWGETARPDEDILFLRRKHIIEVNHKILRIDVVSEQLYGSVSDQSQSLVSNFPCKAMVMWMKEIILKPHW